jgi:hypothetical protein
MLKIRLEEERQRKRLQIIAESATNAKIDYATAKTW